MKVGIELKIDFDIESREFNGNWYTDIKAWKIEPANSNESANAKEDVDLNEIMFQGERAEEDDLPF